MARKRKDESGVASATVQLSKESKQDRINRKLKKVKAKKNENKKPGRPKKLKIQDIEVVFSTITREPDVSFLVNLSGATFLVLYFNF